MKRLIAVFCLTVVFLSSMCSEEKSTNTEDQNNSGVRTMTYNGWEQSVEISNQTTRVVVVPAIGRIMYYSLIGDRNMLWENPEFFGQSLPEGEPYRNSSGDIEWANFGGDKVWPTEQSKFPDINGRGWPPDHWFDGGVHESQLLEHGVRITSMVSEYCGARSIREITLDPETSQLTIAQTIEKVKPAQRRSVEPINYTIWNVTQVRNPKFAIFNLNPSSHLDNGYYLWSQEAASSFSVVDDVGLFVPHPSRSQKAGADSDHWLGAIIDRTVIGEFFEFDPSGTYPDNGLSAEVYTSPQYTELELLSPFDRLAVGESMHFTITWRLHKLPLDAVTTEQQRQQAVEWLNSFGE